MDVGITGIHFIVLVLVVLGLCSEYSTLSCHFIACQILIVGSDLVYQAASWQDLDDTVGGGLYELDKPQRHNAVGSFSVEKCRPS